MIIAKHSATAAEKDLVSAIMAGCPSMFAQTAARKRVLARIQVMNRKLNE
jgi:hypothetical protein